MGLGELRGESWAVRRKARGGESMIESGLIAKRTT